MREKVTFPTNVPQEVALSYGDGKLCNGSFGDSLMYTLTDDRVMFVPPVVGDRLAQIGARPGEPLIICKAEVKEGTRRSVRWQVTRPEAGEVSQAEPAPAPRLSNSRVAQPQATTAAPRPEPVPDNSQGGILTECLIDAMTAAMKAELAGKNLGCTMRFTSEDVRALASTLYIQRAKGGAR